MPPRYFIGITLPNSISNQISIVQHELYDDKLLLKPLVPHITIVHPNALERLSPLWLLPKIKEIQKQLLPMDVQLGSLSMFNNNNLHLQVKSPELHYVYQEIIALLPKDVISKHFIGKRPFVPHVTVAQAKPKKEISPKYLELYNKQLKNIYGQSFRVKNLTKFEHTAPRQYQIKPII